jgi:hypothetical protein
LEQASEASQPGTVVMGLITRTAIIVTVCSVRRPGRHRAPSRAARAQAKAEQARAEKAEVETEVAGEQAAAIARAKQEDEARGQADLEDVAEKEAKAVPWDRPAEPPGQD